ncbi:MAG: hypothetical protein SF052_02925 [Bacteroidia bacterium]|nr:hypothetical protein [Bacteroidia bacterium]
MNRYPLFVFVFVALCLPAAQGQMMFEVYHVDTLSAKKTCYLPFIYFENNTTVIMDESKTDLRYLAYVLKSHPSMKLSLRADGETMRFDKNRKFINQTRVEILAEALQKLYGIDPKRIIKEDFEAWVWAYSGRSRGQESIPLENRRIICNCVWE